MLLVSHTSIQNGNVLTFISVSSILYDNIYIVSMLVIR